MISTCQAVRNDVECGDPATQRFYWPTAGEPQDTIDLCDADAARNVESLSGWGVIDLTTGAAA